MVYWGPVYVGPFLSLSSLAVAESQRAYAQHAYMNIMKHYFAVNNHVKKLLHCFSWFKFSCSSFFFLFFFVFVFVNEDNCTCESVLKRSSLFLKVVERKCIVNADIEERQEIGFWNGKYCDETCVDMKIVCWQACLLTKKKENGWQKKISNGRFL